jgi:aubergine
VLKIDSRQIKIGLFFQRYGLTIKNTTQPLLVSKAKQRLSDGVEQTYIYLVPELCRLTGLTDDMRNNFQLMKAIADHTRMVPEKRIDTLMKFAQRILGKREVIKILCCKIFNY